MENDNGYFYLSKSKEVVENQATLILTAISSYIGLAAFSGISLRPWFSIGDTRSCLRYVIICEWLFGKYVLR